MILSWIWFHQDPPTPSLCLQLSTNPIKHLILNFDWAWGTGCRWLELCTVYSEIGLACLYTHFKILQKLSSCMPLIDHNWPIMRKRCILDKNWWREWIPRIKIPLYTCIACPYQNFKIFEKIPTLEKGRGPFLQNGQPESWGTPGIFYWDHNEWNKTLKSLFQSSSLTDQRFDRTILLQQWCLSSCQVLLLLKRTGL